MNAAPDVAFESARAFTTPNGCHVRHAVRWQETREFRPLQEDIVMWTDENVRDLRSHQRARRARAAQ